MPADVPRRRTGRPPLDPDDPSVGVFFRVPGKQYDALYQAARRLRVTVPELVRRRLFRPAPRSEPDRG